MLALACFGPAWAEELPAAPTYKSFASPYLVVDTAQVKNLTCYISNVGSKPVSVNGFGLRTPTGYFQLTYNSCPHTKPFTLQPGNACAIGVNLAQQFNACNANVDDPDVLRGSLEGRDANQSVLTTNDMTSASAESEVSPQTIASPQIYGAAGQSMAVCSFFNAGPQAATLSNVRLVTSAGDKVAFTRQVCTDSRGAASGANVVPPDGRCQYWASPIPSTDMSCRAGTTHRSDVRAALALQSGVTVLNQEPLD